MLITTLSFAMLVICAIVSTRDTWFKGIWIVEVIFIFANPILFNNKWIQYGPNNSPLNYLLFPPNVPQYSTVDNLWQNVSLPSYITAAPSQSLVGLSDVKIQSLQAGQACKIMISFIILMEYIKDQIY